MRSQKRASFLWAIALGVVCSVMSVATQAAEVKDPRAAVPLATSAEMKESKALIQDLFKEEFAKRDPAARLQLANKLLGQAVETKDDETARYVLLIDAEKIAVEVANIDTGMKSIQALVELYKVDEFNLKSGFLRKVAMKIRSSEGHKELAEKYLEVAQDAMARNDFLTASSMLKSAQSFARMARSIPLMAKAKKALSEMRIVQSAFNRVRSFEKQLKANPDDPKANYEMGKYTCFIKSDWVHGIAYFEKGSHEGLAAIATLEKKEADAPKDQIALGNAWFELAEKEADVNAKACMQQRAGHWLGLAIKGLTGISRLKVKKKLMAIRLAEGPKRVYLSALKEAGIKSGYGSLGKNGALGYEGKKVSIKGRKLMNSLSQHPPEKGNAAISYDIALRFKWFSGAVGINDTARPKPVSLITFKILGDGKEIWTSVPQDKPGGSQLFKVDVTGVEALELQVHCPGGNAFAQAIWMEPILSK